MSTTLLVVQPLYMDDRETSSEKRTAIYMYIFISTHNFVKNKINYTNIAAMKVVPLNYNIL